jgi:hypothetical protein
MAAWDGCYAQGSAEFEGVATLSCLVPLFGNIVRAVIAFGGIGLFLMLLVGGFNFLFSSGDPKKLEQARGTISQAVVGLIIMSSAYLIVNMIGTFTGVNVGTFTIPEN